MAKKKGEVYVANNGQYVYKTGGKYYYKTPSGELDSLSFMQRQQLQLRKPEADEIFYWDGDLKNAKYNTVKEKINEYNRNSSFLTEEEKQQKTKEEAEEAKAEAEEAKENKLYEQKVSELRKGGATDEQIKRLTVKQITDSPIETLFKTLNGDPKGAYDNYKDYKIDFEDFSKDAENEAQAAAKDLMDISTNADNEEFENVANMLEDEANNFDITTPEGQKDAEDYINTYSEIIKNSDAYKKAMGADRRNRILTALSGGISAAFGVPAMDFTDSADIKEAQDQLKEIHSYLNDQKTKQNEVEAKKREAFINNQKKQAENKKLAAKQKSEYSTLKANTLGTMSAMAYGNLQGEYWNDRNRLKKGINELNSEVGKQNNKRNEIAITQNLSQSLPGIVTNTINGVGGLVGGAINSLYNRGDK